MGDDNPPKGPVMLQCDHGSVCFATAVFESCERLHKIIVITDKCMRCVTQPLG